MSKIKYINDVRVSTKSKRMVNFLVNELIDANVWTTDDFYIEFSMADHVREFSEEYLKNFLKVDGSNSIVFARCFEVLSLPTQPSLSIANGSIWKQIKEEKERRRFTYPLIVKKLFPRITKERYPVFLDRWQKHFEINSIDPWVLALIFQLYGWVTMDPDWFLTPKEMMDPFYKEQLSYRD